MTAGWGEIEVPMDISSRRLALVQLRHLAERGLLSFLRLLSAFLLNVIKRNQVRHPAPSQQRRGPLMASLLLARRSRRRDVLAKT